jgi:hypothetical protein
LVGDGLGADVQRACAVDEACGVEEAVALGKREGVRIFV